MKFKLTVIFLLVLIFGANAQSVTYDNTSYGDDIRTVILQKAISIYDPLPLIALGSSEKLRLSFDILVRTMSFLTTPIFTVIEIGKNLHSSRWNISVAN